MGIYMGDLALGAILQYMVCASFSRFLWLVRVKWQFGFNTVMGSEYTVDALRYVTGFSHTRLILEVLFNTAWYCGVRRSFPPPLAVHALLARRSLLNITPTKQDSGCCRESETNTCYSVVSSEPTQGQPQPSRSRGRSLAV